MAFCTKCGTQALEGAVFCGGCGNALNVDTGQVAAEPVISVPTYTDEEDFECRSATPTAVSLPVVPVFMPHVKNIDEKFCSTCGKLIHAAAGICPWCGVRQQSSVAGVRQQPSVALDDDPLLDEAKKNTVNTVVGAIVIVAIVIGGVFVCNSVCNDAGEKKAVARRNTAEAKRLAAEEELRAVQAQREAAEARRRREREPVARITVGQLVKDFYNEDANQSRKGINYNGKWIEVSGKVVGVRRPMLGGEFYIDLDSDDNRNWATNVAVYLEDPSVLPNINEGQRLTVVGYCCVPKGFYVDLTKARITSW